MSFILFTGLLAGLFYAVYFRIRDILEGRDKDGLIAVVVCGDISRSPRMCNHIDKIAQGIQNGAFKPCSKVLVMGYADSPLPESWAHNGAIDVRPLKSFQKSDGSGLLKRVLGIIRRMQVELLTVWFTLAKVRHLKAVLIQNPPAAPHSLLLALLCFLRGARLIIDVHNYGYTIAQSKNFNTKVTRVLRILEEVGFRCAHERLVVSKAMQEDLKSRLHLDSTVVYDLPTARFRSASTVNKADLFKTYEIPVRSQETATVITATSYTPDEDLGMFLDALCLYARAREAAQKSLPFLQVIITGKGPLRDAVRKEISLRDSELGKHVDVCQVFTSLADYPRMIATADLGVSLHTSSSKLDIPMKVVDMLAVKVPVISYDYPTMQEVLPDKCREFSFTNSQELCQSLVAVFKNFQGSFRDSVFKSSHPSNTWEEQWDCQVQPLLLRIKKTA